MGLIIDTSLLFPFLRAGQMLEISIYLEMRLNVKEKRVDCTNLQSFKKAGIRSGPGVGLIDFTVDRTSSSELCRRFPEDYSGVNRFKSYCRSY